MFIFEVTVVLYFIKILSGSRNFYRLRMTSLTYVNECFHDFMFVNRVPPPGKFSSTALLQSLAKSLLHYSSTIRTIRRLFADYSYYSSTIRGLFVLFVDYSYYSSTIRTIRFTILVLSIAYKELILEPVDFAKDLGLLMDSHLSYDKHISNLVSSCLYILCQINRVKNNFDKGTLTMIITSLVISKLLYCSTVCTCISDTTRPRMYHIYRCITYTDTTHFVFSS